MIPEATSVTADIEPTSHQLLAAQAGYICAACQRNAVLPLRTGSRLCEHCLLGLALDPLEFAGDAFDADTTTPCLASRTLGPYTLTEEIGRGGMGVIYRAVHRETSETVAVKTILPQYEGCAETLARFRREAEAAQSLDHLYSMPIHEIGCSDQAVPFFSMKLAHGGSLHQLNGKYRGRWRQTAELMVKVSQAVHHAHCRGILHRDIKPGNILFTEDHEPLVTDFGLAKPLTGADDLTRSCAVLGTPSYVAPEQAAGKTRELTAAADIYSLGAVLYELLTGRPPFIGDNPLQVLEQVGRAIPVRPRRLTPTVPEVLDRICMRCLERVPKDRYASAQEFGDDLERWLDGAQLAPRPAVSRLSKFAKRRFATIAWCGFICALVTSSGLVWKIIAHSSSYPSPLTSVMVVVDDLEQSDSGRESARQLTQELQLDLLACRKFSLKNEAGDLVFSEKALLDPLNAGRTVNAQTVLTCWIGRAGDQTHLIAQLLRCDSGKLIWKKTETLPKDKESTLFPLVAKTLIEDLSGVGNSFSNGNIKTDRPAPLSDAQAFYARALELTKHRNQRDMEAAITLFRKASEADPKFVDARGMLAYALWVMACYYDEADQYVPAHLTAQEALKLDSDCVQAHRVIACCYMSETRYIEALDEFWKTVELNPSSAGSCLALGVCLRRMGHPEQAIPWLERSVQLEPAYGTFHAQLAEMFGICGLDDKAEFAAQRAVELEQDTPDPQFAMVALRIWQKRFDEARRLCIQAQNRFPDYRLASNFRAWLELADGNLQEAQSQFAKLRADNSYQKQWIFHGAVNPSSALAYIARQNGLLEQAKALHGEALRTDFELLSKYPHNCRVLHDLAATYAAVGDEQRTFQYLKESLGAGWAEHRSTRIDPRFSAFSSLPSFVKLLDETEPSHQHDLYSSK